MSEFIPLREAIETLADRAQAPAFDELQKRATGRARRRTAVVAAATVIVVALATAAVIAGTSLSLTGQTDRATGPAPRPNPTTAPETGPNGWVALERAGALFLSRPNQPARRLHVPGSASSEAACPTWSPDGTQLLFARTGGGSAAIVTVAVTSTGTAGTPNVINLDGFEVDRGFDAHPCATWAPDGRWVALAGGGQVWVIDTVTRVFRRLPDLRPSDLEWRPGTDDLTIAGDLGTDREDPILSTAVRVYSVTTGELHQLGSIEAAHITWSPDGATLAYTNGETNPARLTLVDSNGTNQRVLVKDMGDANHGIGPVWSPAGDRIVYQRLLSREDHEIVLVDVNPGGRNSQAAQGIERVLAPPEVGGQIWYPGTVTWAPDGKTLLAMAWDDQGAEAAITVPADQPEKAALLADGFGTGDYYGHQWSPNSTWGRATR